jgi:hypothetical protein
VRDYIEKQAERWKADHPRFWQDGNLIIPQPPLELFRRWGQEQELYYTGEYYSRFDIKI